MKKITPLLIALASALLVTAQNSWKFGPDSLTAVYTPADSTLSIYGSGIIPNNYSGEVFSYEWELEHKNTLRHLVLGDSITALGQGVFSEFTALHDVVIGRSMETIYAAAFWACPSLRQVTNHSSHLRLNYSAFQACGFRGDLYLPGVVYIENNVFSGCDSVRSITLPDLQYMEEHAVNNCPNLHEFTFPASMQEIYTNAIYRCDSISKITTAMPEDVIVHNYGYIVPACLDTIVAQSTYVLDCWCTSETEVIAASDEIKEAYRARGYYFEEIDNSFDHRIASATTLTADSVAAYTGKSLLLDYSEKYGIEGSLTVTADAPMHFTHFHKNDYYGTENTWNAWNQQMMWNPEDPQLWFSRYYSSLQTSLILEADVTADTVSMRTGFALNEWFFTSLPYDLAVSDIDMPDETYIAIRHFDPVLHAQGREEEEWVDYLPGETIPAGTGFIIRMCDIRPDSYPFLMLEHTAPAAQTNNIFVHTDVTRTLEHHAGAQPWSGNWNLVAQPYPSFYNARDIASDGLIGVYNGSGSKMYGYSFYSLTDDYYVLQPGECFFYQARPNENTLTFPAEGRRLTARPDSVTRNYNDEAEAPARAARTLWNIRVSDGEHSDRCRIVLNDAAAYDYEIGVDAPKMSIGDEPILVSSTMGDARLAINERPVGNGSVFLNFCCRQAGDYTLSLDEEHEGAILVDHATNTETALTEAGYTFHASAGDYPNRFELRFGGRTQPTDLTVVEEAQAEAEAYTILGQKTDIRSTGAVTIIRRGGKVTKVLNY